MLTIIPRVLKICQIVENKKRIFLFIENFLFDSQRTSYEKKTGKLNRDSHACVQKSHAYMHILHLSHPTPLDTFYTSLS